MTVVPRVGISDRLAHSIADACASARSRSRGAYMLLHQQRCAKEDTGTCSCSPTLVVYDPAVSA